MNKNWFKNYDVEIVAAVVSIVAVVLMFAVVPRL